jgi:hypothetical protein
MNKQLWNSLGIVVKGRDPHNAAALGSCFALEKSRCFLTAAHCVANIEPTELSIMALGSGPDGINVTHLRRHPIADLALMSVDLPDRHDITPIRTGITSPGLGDSFIGAGFPIDTTFFGNLDWQITTAGPKLRLFRGYFQRWSIHLSHLGYKYYSYELSIGTPAGLSGSPVCTEQSPEDLCVVGFVTENRKSTTILSTVTDFSEPGREIHEKVSSLVEYGISIDLLSVRDWLLQNLSSDYF